MLRLIAESPCHFLLNLALSTYRTTNMPLSFFGLEVGNQPTRYVMFGIPDRDQFHILNIRIIHPSVVIGRVLHPNRHNKGSDRPLN